MEKLITRLGKLTDIVAGILVSFIVLLTVTDVVLRYFGKPILGTYEIVAMSGALIIGISALFTYSKQSHIRVDTILAILPKKISYIFNIITRLMVLFVVGMTGVALIRMGFKLFKIHEVTATLFFPYYPVVCVIGVSFLIVCIAVVYDIIINYRRR